VVVLISGNTRSTLSGARHYLLNSRVKGICHLLGAAVTVFALQSAYSQMDATSFPDQNSLAQQVVSKNQLLTPDKAQKAMDRAYEHFLRGRYASAQKEIQRALDICPHCASAHTFQGLLHLQGGNYPEAASSFQRAIDQDPASGPAYLGIGMVDNTQGRFKDALVRLDRAAPYLPGSWLLYFESALAHLGVGESTAGLRELTHADGLTGSDPMKLSGDACLHGVAQFQLKDYEGGKKLLEEAVKRQPNGTYATLAKRWLEGLASRIGESNDKTAWLNQSPLSQRTK
jgi:tetratricopeptide (TPR) repeat protein